MRSKRLALLIGVVCCSGCATIPWRATPRPTHELPAALREYYAQPAIALAEQREPLTPEPSSRWIAQRVTLSAPDMAHPIQLDWYAPHGPGRRPAVLIFPILWGNDLGVRDFAQGFARQGLHGIIVYRPKEKFSMEKPLSQLEDHFRETVRQARQVVDWLETQPSVDTTRLGSLGISMGASLNVLVAAAEPRITRYVFCLPASHLAHVTMTTHDRSIAKKRDEYLRRYGLTAEAAERELTEGLRSEPLEAAPTIDPKRSLVVIALADRVIGRRNSLDIWRALGRPPTIWLPTGHYTA
ncbi:MAG: dienelactone hydrolase family protein, partial [Candidatus Omnitrophica bacterium]|nr:dienelactone hydrolase family protein [Candidatus Omnitrophota bacterium]